MPVPNGPWVSLQFVIVVFPDHTHLPLDVDVHVLIANTKADAIKVLKNVC